MPQFVENFWGEKNNGFDILYHNMKHGQISTKEVADFIRERMTVEEVYAKSLTKLAKTASNNSQLGTFAPMWEVFRASSERLASCHQELSRKLMELIREVQKYGDEQAKQHKKTKEEVSGTLEAVQSMQTTTQALLKAKEAYNSKHQETERLKKEGNHKEYEKSQVKSRKAMEAYKVFVEKYANVRSDFEHKMTETAQRFQEIEEAHLQSLHDFIKAFSQAVEDTHALIGQVHMEFRQQVRDITADNLIEKYSESKGTGKERPGPIEFEECNSTNSANMIEGIRKRTRKAFGRKKKEKDTDSTESPDADSVPQKLPNGAPNGYVGEIEWQRYNSPEVDDEGFSVRPEPNQNETRENHFYSSSDEDSEDEDRKRFHVEIKPVQPRDSNHNPAAAIEELKASIGNIMLSSPATVRRSPGPMKRNSSTDELSRPRRSTPTPDNISGNSKTNSDLLAALDPLYGGAGESDPTSPGPSPVHSKSPQTTNGGGGGTGGTPLIPPPRPPSRPKLLPSKLGGIEENPRAFSPPLAPLARAESSSSMSSSASMSAATTPTYVGASRGPSPLTLSAHDSVPIAAAFTESVSAYFKGADHNNCLVKVVGEMTVSFPAGVARVFGGSTSPPVLSFRLRHARRLEAIKPNHMLLFSDPSQSDPNCKDFWVNMAALTTHLKKLSDQNPTATYYNVDVLRYEVSVSGGAQSVPLSLVARWKCEPTATEVQVDYRFNSAAMAAPVPLTSVQVIIPVDGGVLGMQAQPPAIWNAEQSRALWKIPEISDKSDGAGCGTLRARLDVSSGPSSPSTLAVQFGCEGASLSGLQLELVGHGYRLSLLKKRMTTGKYLVDC